MTGVVKKFAAVLIVVGAVLLAGPAFGFSSIAADRSVAISTATGSDMLLGVDAEENVNELRGGGDSVVVATLTNNANEDMTVTTAEITSIGDSSVDDTLLTVVDPEEGDTIGQGASQELVVACNGTDRENTREVIFRVDVSGETVSITSVTISVEIDIQCQKGSNGGGGNGAGAGFDSVFASDVSGFVDPGEERQTFRFVLAGNKQPNEQIEIDLSDPRNNGINYDQTFRDGGDLIVEEGSGEVWATGDSIIYQVSSHDKRNDKLVISVGNYSTDGNGGPYDVTFIRQNTGESTTTQFEIDGEEGAGDPFIDATAENVQSDTVRQNFSFVVGQRIQAWEEVRIDVSDATGNGIEYDHDVQLERGPGTDDRVWRSGNEIAFQANDENNAGKEIVVSIGVEVVDNSSGPFDVTFVRTDTGDQTDDTFTIE